MRFRDIPEDDWREFASVLFDGTVNKVEKCETLVVVVNITTEWCDDGEEIECTDDVLFRVPFVCEDDSISAEWSLSADDFYGYYKFLLDHNVNPLRELFADQKEEVCDD